MGLGFNGVQESADFRSHPAIINGQQNTRRHTRGIYRNQSEPPKILVDWPLFYECLALLESKDTQFLRKSKWKLCSHKRELK